MDHNSTTYSLEKPSFGWTTSTTQFDEELVRRGIVTKEQALIAKGMSAATAQQLLHPPTAAAADTTTKLSNEHGEEEEDEDNDEFLRDYRKKRLQELQQGHREPRIIDRTEWKRHVNDASEKEWVLVCLTSSDVERTGGVEEACRQLAQQKWNVVFIPAHSAIANWPHENLPSLFLYRHGKMQQELLRLAFDTNVVKLKSILEELGAVGGDGEDLEALD